MIRADKLTLISEAQPHGVFDTHTETNHDVYCTWRSIGMREAYTARSIGLNPELVFTLSNHAEYGGEKLCEFGGVRYRIVRTYVNSDSIDLTVERVVG